MEPSLDSSDTAHAAASPLAAALLPVLLHRINNVTQLLAGVHSVLSLTLADAELTGEPAPPSLARGEDLIEASRHADELGWLLGVVGCGLGADLLLERREPRGLDASVRLAQQALQRAGSALVLEPEGAWPALSSAVPSHGDLCWCVAYGLWFAGGGVVRCDLDHADGGSALQCEGVQPVDWTAVRPAFEQRLPGASLEQTGKQWTLRLPEGWLERMP